MDTYSLNSESDGKKFALSPTLWKSISNRVKRHDSRYIKYGNNFPKVKFMTIQEMFWTKSLSQTYSKHSSSPKFWVFMVCLLEGGSKCRALNF